MKKILLTLSAGLFIAAGAKAQTFLVQSGSADTVIENYSGNDELKVYNQIKSASAAPVTIEWKVLDKNIGAGWTVAGPCDNIACRDWNAAQAGTLFETMPIGNTYEDFHIQFNGVSTAATGSYSYLKVNLKDKNSSYNRNISLIGIKTPQGIGIIKSDDNVVIFPNPAREAVNVVFDATSDVRSVAVYNLIGRAVKVYKTSGNSAKVELNDVPAGVYFLRLMNSQGMVVATRKFNHQ